MSFSKHSARAFFAISLSIVISSFVPLPPAARASEDRVTYSQMEEFFLNHEETNIFAVAKVNFAPEFEHFIQDLTDLVNSDGRTNVETNKVAFDMGRDFTQKLMLDNAAYLPKSHLTHLRQVQASHLEFIEYISHDKKQCLNFILLGGDALEAGKLDDEAFVILEQLTAAALEAVSMGRRFPVDHEPPTGQDYANLLESWSQQADYSDAFLDAIVSDALSEDIYCDATISLLRHLISDEDPGTDRIIVELTVLYYLP